VPKPVPSVPRNPRNPGTAATTRERILDVALDLFTEKGFDKTSLREIAAELGFSKAALYYHFASKDDILLALHMRLHDVGHGALARLGDQRLSPDLWGPLFEQFVVEMLSNRKLFLLHERNRAAFEQLHTEAHTGDHDDLEAQLRAVLRDSTVPLRDRVRMACALGAVMGGLLLSGDVFADVPGDELTGLLQGAVHDLLDSPPSRRKGPAPKEPRAPRVSNVGSRRNGGVK
jgi:AcrR family transcriptional regulator